MRHSIQICNVLLFIQTMVNVRSE